MRCATAMCFIIGGVAYSSADSAIAVSEKVVPVPVVARPPGRHAEVYAISDYVNDKINHDSNGNDDSSSSNGSSRSSARVDNFNRGFGGDSNINGDTSKRDCGVGPGRTLPFDCRPAK